MIEIIMYIFFGVLTTVVNFLSYLAADNFLNTAAATAMAWILSVGFAFITNKIFVFKKKSSSKEKVLKEAAAFVSCRLFSGILDVGVMILGADVLLLNKMLVKIGSNVIVVIINYFASKLLIFGKN